MTLHVALEHVSLYRYDRPVALGPQIVRLRPAPHCRTRILNYALRITPETHFINWQQDPQANYLAHLVFPDSTRELRIEVALTAEIAVFNPFDFFLDAATEKIPFTYLPASLQALRPYLTVAPAGPLLAAYLATIARTPTRTLDFLVSLNQRLQREISYVIRLEHGVQTPEQTLALGRGSCRDSSWLLVQILRHLGLAARFVSGYLIQLVSDVTPREGPSGPTRDFTDLHAWCEVFLPGAGWVGLDPTSGLLAGEGHLPLACTPDYESAAPIVGTVDACEMTFEHTMAITRIAESPRVTRPYSEKQWAAIDALGALVDDVLLREDVRLTQGGEPTFIADDAQGEPEWSTEALGTDKRARASALLIKLRRHYAPLGLVHQGQGKWYPGEVLPRWSLNLYWRRDGEPLWHEPALLIADDEPRDADVAQSRLFLETLATQLGCDRGSVFAAYEDVWYALWRERRLPLNLDPFDSRLADPIERARLRRLFTQGLEAPVGYAMPLAGGVDGWQTGQWFLREERCYLIPGESPLGLRLPLDSLPWSTPADNPPLITPDPLRPQFALPPQASLCAATHDTRQGVSPLDVARPSPRAFESAQGIIRTALCTEPRRGRLHLFMPPLETLEAYLSLLAAVEATAQTLNCPVVIEGYAPPHDSRLQVLRVTPDPGVVEVNVHPVADWSALREQTEFLYAAAHASRLTSEKFLLDGRHTGTGGGNHFVLGAASPVDSPFLRRPDLLASMVAYWHNHPALSYLFSGMFIGPTSQAPRADEARHEALYELEIAFRELRRQQKKGPTPPPWLVDRLFRNLLIDASGNTHRAEFCIDKLYTPEQVSGRLGLLELRAFEMPPHARMSLVQQLLLRALVARFWQTPYRPARLQRWGTALHDRFMLPHFLWDDFTDVLTDLRDAGFGFDPAWFMPHFEFRFPRLGEFVARNITVELRSALEPWHVLGEEATAGGTARYVDSSLERLQVKLTGMIEDRHALICNGYALPLQPTGTGGEYVAGVRYRAWQPPNCLQPTIGVHSPLMFTLVDTWSSRALGGCQYQVMHPGGRSYEHLPVNAHAAEARRLARFQGMGGVPGVLSPAPVVRNPDYPLTLDLRHPGT